jgi:hypothetical protein
MRHPQSTPHQWTFVHTHHNNQSFQSQPNRGMYINTIFTIFIIQFAIQTSQIIHFLLLPFEGKDKLKLGSFPEPTWRRRAFCVSFSLRLVCNIKSWKYLNAKKEWKGRLNALQFVVKVQYFSLPSNTSFSKLYVPYKKLAYSDSHLKLSETRLMR